MNLTTHITGPDGSREITTLSPKKADHNILSLTVTDAGEIMFMDTDLERLFNIDGPASHQQRSLEI